MEYFHRMILIINLSTDYLLSEDHSIIIYSPNIKIVFICFVKDLLTNIIFANTVMNILICSNHHLFNDDHFIHSFNIIKLNIIITNY